MMSELQTDQRLTFKGAKNSERFECTKRCSFSHRYQSGVGLGHMEAVKDPRAVEK